MKRERKFFELENVSKVVIQDNIDYTKNLEELKPDFVIHGDDWREGPQKLIREKVIETLKGWEGQLIEEPYTKGFSSSDTQNLISKDLKSPDYRRSLLRRMINLKPYVTVMEASNGITGLIVENTKVIDKETSLPKEFDAMWISSRYILYFHNHVHTTYISFITIAYSIYDSLLQRVKGPII